MRGRLYPCRDNYVIDGRDLFCNQHSNSISDDNKRKSGDADGGTDSGTEASCTVSKAEAARTERAYTTTEAARTKRAPVPRT